jgi:hypothetical protein
VRLINSSGANQLRCGWMFGTLAGGHRYLAVSGAAGPTAAKVAHTSATVAQPNPTTLRFLNAGDP